MAKYKNILVISDNPYLAAACFDLIQRKQFSESRFALAVSPFSNPNDFNQIPSQETHVFNLKNADDVAAIIKNYDLVLSMHCKQIFPEILVKSVKCINVHPGYNPINRGWYPQVFAIIHQLPVGATIHEIDEKLDHGPIIARAFVEQQSIDTSESLYNKVVEKEIELLEAHLDTIIAGTYQTIAPESEGNLYLKKDFNDLLEIDLNEQITVGAFIDRLRALTHGQFNNAYFIDPKTKKKVFVGLRLKAEEN